MCRLDSRVGPGASPARSASPRQARVRRGSGEDWRTVAISRRKVEPSPTPGLRAVSRPPIASASDRLMARPSPSPRGPEDAHLVVALLEGIEDPGQHRRRDADARVGELDDEAAGALRSGGPAVIDIPVRRVRRADDQLSARRGELGGVAHEVPGDLHDPRVVGPDVILPGVQLGEHIQPGHERLFAADLLPRDPEGLLACRRTRYPAGAGRGRDPQEIEQVVDQAVIPSSIFPGGSSPARAGSPGRSRTRSGTRRRSSRGSAKCTLVAEYGEESVLGAPRRPRPAFPWRRGGPPRSACGSVMSSMRNRAEIAAGARQSPWARAWPRPNPGRTARRPPLLESHGPAGGPAAAEMLEPGRQPMRGGIPSSRRVRLFHRAGSLPEEPAGRRVGRDDPRRLLSASLEGRPSPSTTTGRSCGSAIPSPAGPARPASAR